jgi:serine phosphatase RsbU (regulator of sigma subunit)/PAS domain-containing protein
LTDTRDAAAGAGPVASTDHPTPERVGTPALDRLAALAARILGAPSGQVTLLNDLPTQTAASRPEGDLSLLLGALTARAGRPLVVDDAVRDRRIAAMVPTASGGRGSYLGVPLVDADRRTIGALCVFGPQPRRWSDGDVTLLIELAAVAVGELERATLTADFDAVQTRLGLAMDAAGIGSFDLDLASGHLSWDERLVRMFGHDLAGFGETIMALLGRVHPDDRPHVDAALHDAGTSGGDLDTEFRIVLPHRETRWVVVRGKALRDESGKPVRILGAAHDTTDQRDAATRVVRVLETMSAGFYSLDRDWRFDYVNARAEMLLERGRDDLLGGVFWDLFPAAVESRFELAFRAAVTSGEPIEFEAHYPEPLDRWYEVRALPSPDGLSVYLHDVTARRQAREDADRAREDAARTAARIDLLGEVSARFAAELDPGVAVGRLAGLVAPALADWAVVALMDDAGRPRAVGRWHADPARLAALDELSEHMCAALARDHSPGPIRDLNPRLGAEHGVVFPLVARGRTLGALGLFTSAERGSMTPIDVATARQVADRAALGLDNARLYRQQLLLAEGLQRSLLTKPPVADDLQIVVRYVPAAEAARVGGDWYDAFLAIDGGTLLAIGDVVGHDTRAAAAMGQVRGLLRGIAFTTGDSPAAVLTRLDHAVNRLHPETTVTCVVARVEPGPSRRDGATRIRWSNAGHPPPMVVSADGSVTVLATARADLLLGWDPDTTRAESEVLLGRGDTLLMYTDGLIERRGEDIDEGLDRLRAALRRVAARPLDQLCDELLATMRPLVPDDDVAVIAVRSRDPQQ